MCRLGEIRQRLEEMVRRMIQQGMDPKSAEIDWAEMRKGLDEPAQGDLDFWTEWCDVHSNEDPDAIALWRRSAQDAEAAEADAEFAEAKAKDAEWKRKVEEGD